MTLNRRPLYATPRLAAYHEAGHAVAAYFYPLAGRTTRVTIRPQDLDADDVGAHYSEPTPRPGGPSDLEVVRSQAIVALAGLEVDRRLTGDALTCATADYEAVRDLLSSACLPSEIEAAVASVTPEEAERLGLDALAEKASADVEAHLETLLAELVGEARGVIDARWANVEAVAEALLERGCLDGEEVRRIIAGVGRDVAVRRGPALLAPTVR